MTEPPKTASDKQEPQVAFDYIKSQFFRVIRADGAIGSITPSQHIHFALFSERLAIPRRIVSKLTPTGTVGELIPSATETRNSIVREMDVDVFVTADTAKNLALWLLERVEELEKQNAGRGQ